MWGSARFPLRKLCLALAAAGGLMPAADALALWGDRFFLIAEEKLTYDSNLFRLSDDRNPVTTIGSSRKSDIYSTTSLGFALDVPISRQRVQAGYTRNFNRYDRFSFLDNTGHDGRAVWLWQVGNQLSGELGYTETKALTSFADLAAKIPNMITVQQAFFNGAYLLTPSWRLQAGVGRREQSNELAVFKVSDLDVDTAEFTVSYISRARNQIGLNLKVEDGSYPNRTLGEILVFDTEYRQETVQAVVDWTITGRSHVNARAGRVSRSHPRVPQRDFDGATFVVAYDWKPTGRLTLSAIAQRAISVFEEVNTSYVLVKGITLRPTLELTGRTSLQGELDYAVRDYLGELVPAGQPLRSDRVKAAGLTLSYRPHRVVQVLAGVRHESRSSNTPFRDYDTTIVSVSARLTF